jgi:hypothetical protein
VEEDCWKLTGWVSEEESENEGDSLVYTSDLLGDMEVGDDGDQSRMIGKRVEVITRSGRRAGHLIYS